MVRPNVDKFSIGFEINSMVQYSGREKGGRFNKEVPKFYQQFINNVQ